MRPGYPSVYAICVGAMMILMWTTFIVLGQVPELQTRPAEIILHLVAEFSTAILLIIGGIASLSKRRWAGPVQLTSMGMLLYTLVVSPGYYIQNNGLPFVVMFGALLVLTVGAIVSQTKRMLQGDQPDMSATSMERSGKTRV